MKKHISIYTDGACKGNPGPGGWGVLFRYGIHEKTLKGSEAHTTNNRMELTAALMGLRGVKSSCQIDLYTDSRYLQKGITEWLPKWKKNNWTKSDRKPVVNVDLWQALEIEIEKHHIRWHWVKAHNGHAENELADTLANEAIDEMFNKK